MGRSRSARRRGRQRPPPASSSSTPPSPPPSEPLPSRRPPENYVRKVVESSVWVALEVWMATQTLPRFALPIFISAGVLYLLATWVPAGSPLWRHVRKVSLVGSVVTFAALLLGIWFVPDRTATVLGGAPQPELLQPSITEATSDVTIDMGTNTLQVSTSELRKAPVDPFLRTWGAPSNLRVYVKDSVLCVDTELMGPWTGRPAITVKCNVFSVFAPGSDKNSNSRAFEVVDERRRPIVQLIFTSPASLSIMGEFRLADGAVRLVTETGMITNPDEKARSENVLTPLFKYPSWRYPGELAN
jgi:hypothetical protein